MIRELKEEDIPVILDWYNDYIKNGVQTFEIQPLSLEAFRERVHRIISSYPFLILEDKGMKGYAYLDHFNAREAYDATADVSIYLKPGESGKGYGTILMNAIMEAGKKRGYKTLMSLITEGNTASEHLHEKCGFTCYARFPKLGYKFNKWLGVSFWLKQINDFD